MALSRFVSGFQIPQNGQFPVRIFSLDPGNCCGIRMRTVNPTIYVYENEYSCSSIAIIYLPVDGDILCFRFTFNTITTAVSAPFCRHCRRRRRPGPVPVAACHTPHTECRMSHIAICSISQTGQSVFISSFQLQPIFKGYAKLGWPD